MMKQDAAVYGVDVEFEKEGDSDMFKVILRATDQPSINKANQLIVQNLQNRADTILIPLTVVAAKKDNKVIPEWMKTKPGLPFLIMDRLNCNDPSLVDVQLLDSNLQPATVTHGHVSKTQKSSHQPTNNNTTTRTGGGKKNKGNKAQNQTSNAPQQQYPDVQFPTTNAAFLECPRQVEPDISSAIAMRYQLAFTQRILTRQRIDSNTPAKAQELQGKLFVHIDLDGATRKITISGLTSLVRIAEVLINCPYSADEPEWPQTWNALSTSPWQRVTLSAGDQGYAPVVHKLTQTVRDAMDIKVERIENQIQYRAFYKERQWLTDTGILAREKALWHGCGNTDPQVLIQSEIGFDVAKAKDNNLWGEGIYFAENASYSDKYSNKTYHKDGTETHRLFLCKVVTGRQWQLLCTDRSLCAKKLPEQFDSVIVPQHRGSTIHVLYHNNRAYPEYLVSYKVRPEKKAQ
eukprot:TRINITY_DN112429_c0_g1_i1.p1 TRINITY_DN112429_c0_g1~~TRINITY_DN112429_c0_g1_i1.p1  ORF type:complete len:517 (-),score=47.68 TRINITY_DN112429_c0_g1_i1:109-1491(-)